jgi:hypothetical protein
VAASTSAPRPPRVVAELGRPETPEETAARKAENSRKHRSNQTLINLVLALAASLAIVLFLVLVVVRPDGATVKPVDYRAAASQSQPTVSSHLAAPDLPKGWTANLADVETGSDGIVTWSIGFITPKQQYIGFVQGLKANSSWLSDQVQNARSTSSESLAGLDWAVYNRRTADDPGNYAYSMTTATGPDSIVLHGTASKAEFHVLAQAIVDDLGR